MKLTNGHVLADLNGNEVSYEPGKPFAMSFFRNVDCVDCIPRAYELSTLANDLISRGNYWVVIDNVKDKLKDGPHIDNYPFPIIPDQQLKIFADFGLRNWLTRKVHPFNADLLFDADGALVTKHLGKNEYDYLPFDQVKSHFGLD